MTQNIIYYDDLEIGQEFPELRHTMTAEIVSKYAEAVEDFNPLFVDKEYAQQSEVGAQIAHPSIASTYILESYKTAGAQGPPGGVHAKQKFVFYEPVIVGEKLITKAKVLNKYIKKEKHKFVELETITKNEDGRDKVYSLITIIWAK